MNDGTITEIADEIETVIKIGKTASGELDWLQKRFYRTHPLTKIGQPDLIRFLSWLRERADEERRTGRSES